MSATNFNTQNSTYRQLMGGGLTYQVPRFQRDYSWGEEEWDDLWHDILGTIDPEGEPAHYMGYLVLKSIDHKQFDVIDGQQRMATLSLLVLAALSQLKKLNEKGKDEEDTKKRMDGLRQAYIGHFDPVTLAPEPKLRLNQNDDDYFQTHLVQPVDDALPKRNLKKSERNLRKAFERFDQCIQKYIKNESDPGKAIASLISTMSDRLFFTVITVTDELNAYKVFETLNARGVMLSATDLLKNHLFSLLHRESKRQDDLQKLDNRWEKIVGRLRARNLTYFLRAHWISRRGFVRKSDLFRTIRGQITTREDALALLHDLEEDMDAYLELTQPDAECCPKSQAKYARNLLMFNVRQPLPLLLVARRKLPSKDFVSLLRAVVIISFRYNVIGNFQTNAQERTYHDEASRVAKGEHVEIQQILKGLRPVYPKDDQFKSSFSQKSIVVTQSRNRRIVRYILGELERQISGFPVNSDDDAISLEHICPTNPDNNWSFTSEEISSFSSRIGNMLLLKAKMNRDIGNSTYDVKRVAFKDSAYHTTRKVGERYEEWTPKQIDARQLAMAKMATSIWRIPQLD